MNIPGFPQDGWMRPEPASRRRVLIATLIASALGMCVFALVTPLLPDVELFYGGVFYLAIAMAYGPRLGALCARRFTGLGDPGATALGAGLRCLTGLALLNLE